MAPLPSNSRFWLITSDLRKLWMKTGMFQLNEVRSVQRIPQFKLVCLYLLMTSLTTAVFFTYIRIYQCFSTALSTWSKTYWPGWKALNWLQRQLDQSGAEASLQRLCALLLTGKAKIENSCWEGKPMKAIDGVNSTSKSNKTASLRMNPNFSLCKEIMCLSCSSPLCGMWGRAVWDYYRKWGKWKKEKENWRDNCCNQKTPLLYFKGHTKSSNLYLADKHLPEAFHIDAQHQLHPKHLKKEARLHHHRTGIGAASPSKVFWTRCFGSYATTVQDLSALH